MFPLTPQWRQKCWTWGPLWDFKKDFPLALGLSTKLILRFCQNLLSSSIWLLLNLHILNTWSCYHYGIQGHTRPNFHKLQALKNVSSQRPRGQGNGKGNHKQSKEREVDPGIGDVMKMINTITSCLANFTLRFENCNSSTQSSKDITPNARTMWMKKGTHA